MEFIISKCTPGTAGVFGQEEILNSDARNLLEKDMVVLGPWTKANNCDCGNKVQCPALWDGTLETSGHIDGSQELR